jgi:hypothetical protein
MPNILDRVVLVFDSISWTQAGGDIGDNSCFWKLARVTATYWKDGDPIADVTFVDNGEHSRGHFVSAIKYCKNLD